MSNRQEDWKHRLTEEEHRVMRENGTERPHSSELNMEWRQGDYHCKGCDKKLFESASKFDAGCGWPSFDQEHKEANITHKMDRSHGMVRVELRCSDCDSHLGHVFPDGPTATGIRYCINGICLRFKADL